MNAPLPILDHHLQPSTVGSRSIRGLLLQVLLIYFGGAFIALIVRTLRMDFGDSWASTLALQGTMIVAAAISIRLDSVSPAEVGLRRPSSGYVSLANSLGVACIALALSFVWVIGRFRPLHPSHPRPLRSDLFWICVFVPVAEEVLLRGWFQTALYRVLGASKQNHIILLSASTFGVLHFFWILRGAPVSSTCLLVLATFGSGCFFARSRDQSGSVIPPIFLHSIYNLVTVLFGVGVRWIIASP